MPGLLITNAMNHQPPFVREHHSINEAVAVLIKHQISGVPVVNEEHQVVGFISEQDCLKAMLVSSYHHEGSRSVREVMNPNPLCVMIHDSIIDLAQQMREGLPKVYPVVETGGRLKGVITRSMLLRILNENEEWINTHSHSLGKTKHRPITAEEVANAIHHPEQGPYP